MQELSKVELLQKLSEQLGKVSKSKEAHMQDEQIVRSFVQQLQKEDEEAQAKAVGED